MNAVATEAWSDELDSSSRLHIAALNAIPAHYLILNARTVGAPIVFANQAAARDFGLPIEKLVGRPFVELAAPFETRSREVRRVTKALLAGREARIELDFVRCDGSTFVLGMTIAPLVDRFGRTTHAVAFGRDITAVLEERTKKQELQEQLLSEMKERERIGMELRLAQRLESVGRLAAGIAHEINTPIQYVGDSVHFLQSAVSDLQELGAAYREAVGELRDSPGFLQVERRLAHTEARFDRTFIDTEIPQAFARTHEGVERVTNIVRAMKEFGHPSVQEYSAVDLNHALQTTLLVARNEYKYVASVETQFADIHLWFATSAS